jgi:FkbM family methyltransferase
VRSPYDFIVDCGANCGHFSLLVDACIRARWGFSAARYIAIEPNPNLLPVIRKNAQDAGMAGRFQVYHGLLGVAGRSGILWVHSRSYLGASARPRQGWTAYRVPVLSLEALLGNEPVDILKVDIEGAEYELLPSVAVILRRTRTLFLEIHRHPTSTGLSQPTLMKAVCESGFSIEAEYIRAGNLLVLAQRSTNGAAHFDPTSMDSAET